MLSLTIDVSTKLIHLAISSISTKYHLYLVSTKLVYLTQNIITIIKCGHPKNQHAPCALHPTRIDYMGSLYQSMKPKILKLIL